MVKKDHWTERNSFQFFTLSLAVFAHFCWGSYPVVTKRLLLTFPPFALVAVGYAVVLLFMLPWLRESFFALRNQRSSMWILLGTSVARMITNVLSIQATRATYVQLINLLTPFVVALLARAIFRETIPRYTFPALIASTLGSFLVIAREPSLKVFDNQWQARDSLGIGLALLSTIFLALYLLSIRYEQTAKGSQSLIVFVQQTFALMLGALITSLCIGESWQTGYPLTWDVCGLFACYVIFNLIGGNLLQIISLKQLGAPYFTSLMGARLIAALILAGLLLNEWLSSLWQLLGAVVVIAAITVYLVLQSRNAQRLIDN